MTSSDLLLGEIKAFQNLNAHFANLIKRLELHVDAMPAPAYHVTAPVLTEDQKGLSSQERQKGSSNFLNTQYPFHEVQS